MTTFSPLLGPALGGPFHFLRPEPEEIRRLAPDLSTAVPAPQPIFLEDEEATPLIGYPILRSKGLEELGRALAAYIESEELVQISIQRRRGHNRQAYLLRWQDYRDLFSRAVGNATLSSYGRLFPGIFWLHHSLLVARLLKKTPQRILRHDVEVGRKHGDRIKYRVLERYLDLAVNITYDVVNGLAMDTTEGEEELFPRLLSRMRDNVLIFTEDRVSPDLSELSSYFRGYLGIDGSDFRQRLERLTVWHGSQFTKDRRLRRAVHHLLEFDLDRDPGELLKRPGYLSFLAQHSSYSERTLPDAEQIKVWESLLLKLKEFELLHALRRLLLPAGMEANRLVASRPRSPGSKTENPLLHLSSATRPFDFMAPWVIDPLVHRFGLIYDITDFSEIVSILRRSGSDLQDRSFRTVFRFQRRINRIAEDHRMRLEKYLGDGAFFSSRTASRLLAAAIQIQREYRREIEDDFPFDRGMRLALNYGQYRLIPIGGGAPGEPERYEFFGHSLIELSRLTTGKSSHDIDELKSMLVSYGYPEATVLKFFSPLQRQEEAAVGPQDPSEPFCAHINSNATLVNEGIVATEAFIRRLEGEIAAQRLFPSQRFGRPCWILDLEGSGTVVPVGLCKLGNARLKGLGRVPIFEIFDGAEAKRGAPIPVPALLDALESSFTRRRRKTEAL